MRKYWKFAALMAVVVGALLWLAVAGMSDAQTYYKSIAEIQQLGDNAPRHVRVGGDIKADSIVHAAGITRFTLVQDKLALNVAYEGRDPLPDTFKDGAQALAGGSMGADGVFHATEVQAKCASKYAPAPGAAPAGIEKQLPAGNASYSSSSASKS